MVATSPSPALVRCLSSRASPDRGGGYGGSGASGCGSYATQWMLNPSEGYLRGAADITKANAQYYQTIQQAKLVRQQAIQEAIRTRRAVIEEADELVVQQLFTRIRHMTGGTDRDADAS